MTRRFNAVSKISFAVTFAISVFSMSTASYAAYTEEQKRLCLSDVLKFCSSDIPDEAKINACMTRHAAELSPKCMAVAPK
jgi:hypothetical protein